MLAYAYAVFHSPAFRARYAAFLKIDFPRLPLPPDRDLFREVVALGHRLGALHLLRDLPADVLPSPRTGGDAVTVGPQVDLDVALKNQGYDLVVVDYQDSYDFIQRNGLALVDLIDRV